MYSLYALCNTIHASMLSTVPVSQHSVQLILPYSTPWGQNQSSTTPLGAPKHGKAKTHTTLYDNHKHSSSSVIL